MTGGYHIELVPDLTATSYVDAFKRFVSTRGVPRTVTSDNAGNFVKAYKLLKNDEKLAFKIAIEAIKDGEKEVQRQFAFQKVEAFTDEATMQWKFIPPLAPEFGGKHEAAVKQVKVHLKKTIGTHVLTFIALNTVLKKIEAMLNSRPLCKAEGSIYERDQILTPAHFLVGRPLTTLPEQEYSLETNLVDRYQIQQRMTQHFWKLWHNQYLTQLQQLPKWTKVGSELAVGEIVLLKEANTPPMTWCKAIITHVYPGNDTHVRVVLTTDSKQTEFKSAIRSIVRLPIVISRGEAADIAGKQGKRPVMPLIAPQKLVSNQAGNQKGTPTDAKDKPTLRRSARNKPSISSVLMLMMSIMCLMTTTSAQKKVQDLAATKSGLIYFHERDIYVKIGTQRVQIETDLNPYKDIESMTKKVARYNRTCSSADARFSKVHCKPLAHSLFDTLVQTILTIREEYEPENAYGRLHRRASYEPGVIPQALMGLWHCIVGSWTHDVDTSEDAKTLVRHSVTAFQHVERQLDEKEKHLERQLSRLSQTIQTQMQLVFAGTDEQDQEIQFMEVYQLLMHRIQTMSEIYEKTKTLWLSHAELATVVDKVKKELKVGQIPNLSVDQLKQITKWNRNMTKSSVEIIMELPIITTDIFHEFFVVPVPISNGMEIADTVPQHIYVSQETNQFLTSPTLQMINETVAITDTKMVNKITATTDYSIVGVAMAKATCRKRKLPTKYDVWILTPVHNQWLYYSTEPRELKCATYSKAIVPSVGVITIAPECVIETTTRRIYPNLEYTNIQKHGFHLNLEEDKEIEMNETKPIIHQNPFVTMDKTSNIQDGELDEVLKDAVNASQEFSSTQWTILSISIMITIVFLIIGILFVILYFKRTSSVRLSTVYETIAMDDLLPKLNTVHTNEDPEPTVAVKTNTLTA